MANATLDLGLPYQPHSTTILTSIYIKLLGVTDTWVCNDLLELLPNSNQPGIKPTNHLIESMMCHQANGHLLR